MPLFELNPFGIVTNSSPVSAISKALRKFISASLPIKFLLLLPSKCRLSRESLKIVLGRQVVDEHILHRHTAVQVELALLIQRELRKRQHHGRGAEQSLSREIELGIHSLVHNPRDRALALRGCTSSSSIFAIPP